MEVARQFVIMVFTLFLFLLLCISILRALIKGFKFPWRLLLIFIGILTLKTVLTINTIHIGSIWIILLILVYANRDKLHCFYISKEHLKSTISLGIVIGLFFAAIYIILTLFKLVHPQDTPSVSFWVFTTSALETYIGEELLYRSFLMGELRLQNFSIRTANFIQGFLFGLAHASRYVPINDFISLLFTLVFGFVVGYLTYKSQNITGAVLAHAIVDLSSLIIG